MLKIVEFDEYCCRCKYEDISEEEEPCRSCVAITAREDSRRPEKYELREEKKSRRR